MDFTGLPIKNKTYAGANGSKISVVYGNELYMLKFPVTARKNQEISYTNGCISEYIGCHIFESIGIPVQKTMLGTYKVNGREKVVVACKDFTSRGVVLQDFASLKNTIVDSEHNGYGTELDDILETLEKQNAIETTRLKERFWNMFIVDALIGNWDRHNGNWGFLYDTEKDTMELAPVYDCGSCLYPQAEESTMEATLNDPDEMDLRIFSIPLSGLRLDGQKIKYFDFISSLKYEECNYALKRIVPKIDMTKIEDIVMKTPYINDLQRKFYKTMLRQRKEKILDFSLRKLNLKEESEKLC